MQLLAREGEYIPNWNRNKELKSADQIKVIYRYMTSVEEEQHTKISSKYYAQDVGIEMNIETKANEIWDLCVISIQGLFNDNKKEITDPKEVQKIPGIYGLITEVVAQIKKGIEIDLKN